MSKFSQLTRGMPPERVRAVMRGVPSRLLYRLGLRRASREMPRQLAIERLSWRLEWWRSWSPDEIGAADERMIGDHLDLIYFRIGEWNVRRL